MIKILSTDSKVLNQLTEIVSFLSIQFKQGPSAHPGPRCKQWPVQHKLVRVPPKASQTRIVLKEALRGLTSLFIFLTSLVGWRP